MFLVSSDTSPLHMSSLRELARFQSKTFLGSSTTVCLITDSAMEPIATSSRWRNNDDLLAWAILTSPAASPHGNNLINTWMAIFFQKIHTIHTITNHKSLSYDFRNSTYNVNALNEGNILTVIRQPSEKDSMLAFDRYLAKLAKLHDAMFSCLA